MTRRDQPVRQVHLAPADTRAGYDRWAAGYDDHDNPMVAATTWALTTTALAVAGAAVIELGCGTGRHVERVLAGGAATYLGVDASPGMLAHARARTDDPRASWLCAEIDAVPLPPGHFQHALIVLVLEHLPTLAPMCAEVARLLAPGGRLRVLELHPALVAAGTGAHFRDGDDEVWFTSVGHDVDALVVALAAAGLAVTRRAEHVADGALLDAVPRLAKHRGRPALLDLEAVQSPRPGIG